MRFTLQIQVDHIQKNCGLGTEETARLGQHRSGRAQTADSERTAAADARLGLSFPARPRPHAAHVPAARGLARGRLAAAAPVLLRRPPLHGPGQHQGLRKIRRRPRERQTPQSHQPD